MSEPSWLDRAPLDPIQLEMVERGCRRAFSEPWEDLLVRYRRIGEMPSANFVGALLLVGALETLKDDDPNFKPPVQDLSKMRAITNCLKTAPS